MAVIRYHLRVKANGETEVQQDVLKITKDDTIVYTRSVDPGVSIPAGREVAILYATHCPYNGSDPKDPQLGVPFLIGPGDRSKGHKVKNDNRNHGQNRTVPGFGARKTFHFECGHANSADPNDGTFFTWAGAGDTPGGGDDSLDP